MTSHRLRSRAAWGIALALIASLAPVESEAQVRRGRAVEQPPPRAPIAIGVRFGWDQEAQGEVLGGQIHVPVTRNGTFEIIPNAEMVFVTGTKDYQYNLDAAYVPGGLRGGLMLGAGVGWRDTALGGSLTEPRKTYFGYNAFLGVLTNLGPLKLELGLRWTFLNDTLLQPNSATFGLNVPLWSARPRV